MSAMYKAKFKPSCFMLFVQEIARAFSRALLRAGNNIPAKIAMIAMTTVTSSNIEEVEYEQKNKKERQNYEKFVQVHPN